MNARLRQVLLRVIPWLHCPLILAPAYACVASMLYPQEPALLQLVRGLGLVVPVALSALAAHYLKWLWQYLLASILLCGGWFMLTGCYVLLGVLCFMIVLRLCARVRKTDTVFDTPSLVAIIFFSVPFLGAGTLKLPLVQLASLLFAVIYLALWFLYKGLQRTQKYVQMNQGIANLPYKRILRGGTTIFVGAAALLLVVVLPVVYGSFRFVNFEMPQNNSTWNSPQQEQVSLPTMGDTGDMAALFGASEQRETPFLLELFGQILIWAALLACLVGLGVGVYRLIKNFKATVREKDDVIEGIHKADEAAWLPPASHPKDKLRAFDFSPNAVVRRRYVKTLRAAKKATPQPWLCPQELEAVAGITNPSLHNLYEKARYSKNGCTKAEAAQGEPKG